MLPFDNIARHFAQQVGFLADVDQRSGGGAVHDAALDLVPGMDAERDKLAGLADHLREGLHDLGCDTGQSTTQIVPAIVGDARDAMTLSARLADRGIMAAAIRPPTVPPGTSRLRLALRVTHDHADIDRLLSAIRDCR